MAQRKAWTALLPDWVMKFCPPHTVYGAMMDACKNASAYLSQSKKQKEPYRDAERKHKKPVSYLETRLSTAISIQDDSEKF